MALVVRPTGDLKIWSLPAGSDGPPPIGLPTLPGSELVLAIPGAPPPSGKGAPAKAGRKLPQADHPQRKVLPGPDNQTSALLPCRFSLPAGQRAGFGHSKDVILVQADDSQAKADPELPPANHLPQRTLPDLGNRPPAPLPVYPLCRAANRSRPDLEALPLGQATPRPE